MKLFSVALLLGTVFSSLSQASESLQLDSFVNESDVVPAPWQVIQLNKKYRLLFATSLSGMAF